MTEGRGLAKILLERGAIKAGSGDGPAFVQTPDPSVYAAQGHYGYGGDVEGGSDEGVNGSDRGFGDARSGNGGDNIDWGGFSDQLHDEGHDLGGLGLDGYSGTFDSGLTRDSGNDGFMGYPDAAFGVSQGTVPGSASFGLDGMGGLSAPSTSPDGFMGYDDAAFNTAPAPQSVDDTSFAKSNVADALTGLGLGGVSPFGGFASSPVTGSPLDLKDTEEFSPTYQGPGVMAVDFDLNPYDPQSLARPDARWAGAMGLTENIGQLAKGNAAAVQGPIENAFNRANVNYRGLGDEIEDQVRAASQYSGINKHGVEQNLGIQSIVENNPALAQQAYGIAKGVLDGSLDPVTQGQMSFRGYGSLDDVVGPSLNLGGNSFFNADRYEAGLANQARSAYADNQAYGRGGSGLGQSAYASEGPEALAGDDGTDAYQGVSPDNLPEPDAIPGGTHAGFGAGAFQTPDFEAPSLSEWEDKQRQQDRLANFEQRSFVGLGAPDYDAMARALEAEIRGQAPPQGGYTPSSLGTSAYASTRAAATPVEQEAQTRAQSPVGALQVASTGLPASISNDLLEGALRASQPTRQGINPDGTYPTSGVINQPKTEFSEKYASKVADALIGMTPIGGLNSLAGLAGMLGIGPGSIGGYLGSHTTPGLDLSRGNVENPGDRTPYSIETALKDRTPKPTDKPSTPASGYHYQSTYDQPRYLGLPDDLSTYGRDRSGEHQFFGYAEGGSVSEDELLRRAAKDQTDKFSPRPERSPYMIDEPDLLSQQMGSPALPQGFTYRDDGAVIGPDDREASVRPRSMAQRLGDVGAMLMPTAGGVAAKATHLPGETVLGSGPIRAYHGSPHDFDRFDLSRIGTGEGAQAYGHGLYFAENEGVARSYRDALSAGQMTIDGKPFSPGNYQITQIIGENQRNPDSLRDALTHYIREGQGNPYSNNEDAKIVLDALSRGAFRDGPPGRMYEVDIHADPERFLDYDRRIGEQHPSVIKTMAELQGREPNLYDTVKKYAINDPSTTRDFASAGIPGLKYLDGGSRTKGDGSRNYVVFDDKLVDIKRKYATGGALQHAKRK